MSDAWFEKKSIDVGEYTPEYGTPPEPVPKFTQLFWVQILGSFSLALFYAIFLWWFWDKGVYALGFNATVYTLGILYLLLKYSSQKTLWQKKNLSLIGPLILIAVSFSFYENPFIKVFNILLFPLLLAIIVNYLLLKEKGEFSCNANLLFRLIIRVLSFLKEISLSIRSYFKLITSGKNQNTVILKKVLIGLGLLFLVAVFLVIPLLSSVDSLFAEKISGFVDFVRSIISKKSIAKIMFTFGLSVFLLANLLSWREPIKYIPTEEKEDKDPIIMGILLGGLLAIYLLFIWVQIERFFIDTLPTDFKETEKLVKSGFWQLIFLSIVNIGFFYASYLRTNKLVQNILALFTGASLLLLVSAGYRMFLYVTFYGFSYEKFYALYAIIFCLILFVWLISQFFFRRKPDIIKFLLFLFIWMFAVVTIFPLDKFIFNVNLSLAKKESSRIDLYELTGLSSDILNNVRETREQGAYLQDSDGWKEWIEQRETDLENKAWYEYNLGNLFTK